MTPLDVAFPQQLAAPQDGMNYAIKPQQPNVQFGHMPHTDHMLRENPHAQPQQAMGMNNMNMNGATPLGPNVEHHERQAPQYEYNHPQQQYMPQQHPQHMQHPQQQYMPPQQHPQQQQHMQHPQQQQQYMQHPQQQQYMQQQARQQGKPPAHMHQRLAQQTGPAPVAAEVITKTKSGMSTNKILLIVLVSVIFLGIGIGIVVICKKNKKTKLAELPEPAPIFRASEF